MKKILLTDTEKALTICLDHWCHITDQYFDREIYQPGRSYDPARTIVGVPWVGAPEWAIHMHEQGYKTVIDNLWEPRQRWIVSENYHRLDASRVHELGCDDFFWLEESLRLTHLQDRGLARRFKPEPTRGKLAWMPMRLRKWHRDHIWERMQSWLPEFYCSYVERGVRLPDDNPMDLKQTQRYINPVWINDTWFTIAVETMVDEYNNGTWGEHHATMSYLGPWPFITEKTYKPIYMQHPFMVYGHSGTLARLRDFGFVTYDNLFDESYDFELDEDLEVIDKVAILIDNVAGFDRTATDLDTETKQRIAHNHDWFFRRDIVKQRAIKNIFEPMMEYAEQT